MKVGEVKKCYCGRDMVYVELTGDFAPRDRTRFVWHHVEQRANFNHQARLVAP